MLPVRKGTVLLAKEHIACGIVFYSLKSGNDCNSFIGAAHSLITHDPYQFTHPHPLRQHTRRRKVLIDRDKQNYIFNCFAGSS